MDRRGFLSCASLGLVAGMAPMGHRAVAQTTSKRELVVAQSFDVTSLDPHASTLSNDWRVAFNLFDTLVRRHPDGTLHTALATAWRRGLPRPGSSTCAPTCAGTTGADSPLPTPSTVSTGP